MLNTLDTYIKLLFIIIIIIVIIIITIKLLMSQNSSFEIAYNQYILWRTLLFLVLVYS